MQSDYKKELTQKVTKEFGNYVTELLHKPPEEIMRSSYATVAKQKIMSVLFQMLSAPEASKYSLTEKEAKALCYGKNTNTLDTLYSQWLGSSYLTMDESVYSFIKEEAACAVLSMKNGQERHEER